MNDDSDNDIKKWLKEVAASDPFQRLKDYRRENPDKPIPEELEFTALYAPILGENDGSLTFDQELSTAANRTSLSLNISFVDASKERLSRKSSIMAVRKHENVG